LQTSNLILDFEFDQHLESHKHVINIIMGFRDVVCYNWPPEPPSTAATPIGLHPRHRPTITVSFRSPLLARRLPILNVILTPKTSPHLGLFLAGIGHATAPPRAWPPRGEHRRCARRAALDGQATQAVARPCALAHSAWWPAAQAGPPRR
jgi:hypothetical protein